MFNPIRSAPAIPHQNVCAIVQPVTSIEFRMGIVRLPLVITTAVFGARGGLPQGAEGKLWLQNAGFVWVPFIMASTFAAWFGMNDIASAKASFAGRWAAKEAVIKAISSSDAGEQTRNLWSGGGAPLRPIFSTRAAQYLNSGIFPMGSSCGLVRKFAGASAKQKGMNTMPSATSRS